jgi:hypothetical protein
MSIPIRFYRRVASPGRPRFAVGGIFQPESSAATACIAHTSLRICERRRLGEPSDFLLVMDDRLNRRRPVASPFFVSKKGELHPAATKKVSGLECVRKTKAAS